VRAVIYSTVLPAIVGSCRGPLDDPGDADTTALDASGGPLRLSSVEPL